MNITLNMI